MHLHLVTSALPFLNLNTVLAYKAVYLQWLHNFTLTG